MKRRTMSAVLLSAGLLMTACGGGDSKEATTASIVIEGETNVAADSNTGDTTDQATGDSSAAEGSTDGSSVDGATSDTAAPGEATTDEEKALALAKCMRDEGIDFPDPTVNEDGSIDLFGGGNGAGARRGGNNEAFREAAEKCLPLIEGASFLPTEADQTELQDQLLKAAECLREQGLDVQDPQLGGGASGGPGGSPFGPNFDPDDPKTQAAIEACRGAFGSLPIGR
jgi:hypothetical protein